MSEHVVDGIKEVHHILASISFAPSCVDMDWKWEVEETFIKVQSDKDGFDMRLDGYRLRTTFIRPDRDTKEVLRGKGRWWEVPRDVSVSGVVKTAFAAAKMILEHEIAESFKWNGIRVFDPHNTVFDLATLSNRK